jgi:hypothetical protein
MVFRIRSLLAIAFALLGGVPAAALPTPPPARPVDLALVLAVDVSASVDAGRFLLQQSGYAAAFRNSEVYAAIETGAYRAIAVVYVQWSGARQQERVIDWTVIDGQPAAEAFAALLESMPRQVEGGSTSLSGAIDYSAALLNDPGLSATRRVIDVSGDGSNNSGRLPVYARDAAVAAGITINGLPILTEEPQLDIYYRMNVIGGPGAFVIATADYGGFTSALVAKLVREIAEVRRPRVLTVAERPPEGVEDR